MSEKPESPVGVYGNLCVTRLLIHRLHRGLRSFDTVLPSPEGTGAASDGDSRECLPSTVERQTEMNRLIDWLFADDSVTGIHTFLVTLVRQFDFSLPENGQKIKKMRPGLIVPVVAGEEHKGPQMPLKVTVLGNE